MIRSLTALAFLSTTGCLPAAALLAANALDNDAPQEDAFQPSTLGEAAEVDTGWAYEIADSNALGIMRGSMPGVGNFDEDLTTAWLEISSSTIAFDLHATHTDWAMLGGGFDASALVEGEAVVLQPDEHWVIGCSGPQPGSFDFDGAAETVTVTTEAIDVDGEAHLEVTIEATFSEGFTVETVVVQARPRTDD